MITQKNQCNQQFQDKKTQGGFNLTYPQGNQIHYDRMEVYNKFSP